MRSRISLLPEEFKKRNKLKQQMLKIVTIAGSVAVCLAIVFASVFIYRIYLNSDLSEIQDEKFSLELEISKMKKYEDTDKKIKKLEGLLKKAYVGSTDWENYFIRLTESVPGGIYLESIITTVGKNNAIQLTLNGYGNSRYKVAEWIQLLKSMPELTDVFCPATTKKGASSLYSFSITANLKGSTPPAKTQSKSGEVNSK